MSHIAVQVRGLGKRYRIGVQRRATSRGSRLANTLLAPFDYLRTSLSPPSEAETLWALRDVSFDVQDGEVLGIVGRNGAGKSTLLKILSQITEPTTGEAVIYGRVGSLLEVGTGFHQELTGRENVYMNGAILGMSKREIDSKFAEIVDFAGVERFIDTQVKRYSSGMKVRLAFAVAAHLEPELLVVDEVLAVGDAEFQRKCLGKMENFADGGRTVLFVSHNMSAVTRLCSRAIFLEQGRKVMEGSPTEVVAAYLDSARSVSAERVWDLASAPGAAELKLLSVRLVDAADQNLVVARVDQPAALQMTYLVAEPGLTFRCSARFHTQGIVAFATLEPNETTHPRPGVYQARVGLPANLLSEGEYTISLSFFTSQGRKAHWLTESDVIAFQTSDPLNGDSARGDYAEKLGGVVRPKLTWDKTYVGPTPPAGGVNGR